MIMWRVRQVFVFLIPFFVWRAVLVDGSSIYGYNFAEVLTYLFGTTILRSLVMGSRTVDLGWMINTGYLTIPLLKPLNIFKFFFVRDMADKLFNLSFIAFEIPLIFLIFHPPVFLQSNLSSIFLFFGSLILAIFIYFFVNIIFGSIGFWSRDVWAPRFLLMVVMEFASGAMFPLDMLPEIWQKILLLTPFPYLIYVPLKIYSGLSLSVGYIIGALIWAAVLYFVTRVVWKKGIMRYEAEGR